MTDLAELSLPLAAGDVVLEVGAGEGGETLYLADQVGPTGRVVAVEAHPHTVEILRGRVRDHENVTVVEAAAWRANGYVGFTYSGDSARRRVVPASWQDAVEVDARTLDSIAADAGLDDVDVDLLKMNIEGAELDALAVYGGISRVRATVIACHDFLGRPTKRDVRALLERRGFTVTDKPDAPYDWLRDYLFATRPVTE